MLLRVPAMATVEQIAAIVQAVLAQHGGGGGGPRAPRRILDERQFRRVEKFAGTESTWKDWCFQLKAAIRGVSRETLELMSWVERAATDMTEEEIETQNVEWQECAQAGGELYDL